MIFRLYFGGGSTTRRAAGYCVSPIALGDRRRGRQHGTVPGDDPPVEQHQFARGVCGDRLRDAAGRDCKEGGRAADRDAVIGDPERAGTNGEIRGK